MKAVNSLIAVGACLVALFYGMDIDLYSVETSLEVTPVAVAWHLDPVFIVWNETCPAAAMTFGNTIVASPWLKNSPKREWILHYEMNHVRQCRALGWMMWPATLVLDMDPFRGAHPVSPDYTNIEQSDDLMWLPPTWWRDRWHFFTIEVRLG